MTALPNSVRYTFDFGNESAVIDISLEEPEAIDASNAPEWTKLTCNQCSCCTLDPAKHKHCPAAVGVHENLKHFQDSASIEQIQLTVETERRTYQQDCDLQSALNSMLGLEMATSGCPVLGKLRAMATFHMPFSSFGETLYRSVSAHLIKQYYIEREGGEPDWELQELKAYYDELEKLNEAFSARIRLMDRNDAVSNSVVMFFATSIVVASALDEGLTEFKDYFTGKSVTPPRGG